MKTVTSQEAITLLQQGCVGVIPTDTVYGVVAQAENTAAVQRLYALKNREQKPGTLVAADITQLVKLGIPRRYLTAVEKYWPNAVSVIVPVPPELAYLHQGLQTLAVRIPGDKVFRTLLEQTGPLLTSSANMPGQPPAESIKQAAAYFGDAVDFYFDGGTVRAQQPSTIIRIIDDAVEVIRQGAVTIDELTGEIV